MKSILKVLIHILKPPQKKFEHFTSKPNAHRTFRNLHIIINFKINRPISEINRSIELKFCIFPILWCRIHNKKINKIVTIDMEISKLSKIQSYYSLMIINIPKIEYI